MVKAFPALSFVNFDKNMVGGKCPSRTQNNLFSGLPESLFGLACLRIGYDKSLTCPLIGKWITEWRGWDKHEKFCNDKRMVRFQKLTVGRAVACWLRQKSNRVNRWTQHSKVFLSVSLDIQNLNTKITLWHDNLKIICNCQGKSWHAT